MPFGAMVLWLVGNGLQASAGVVCECLTIVPLVMVLSVPCGALSFSGRVVLFVLAGAGRARWAVRAVGVGLGVLALLRIAAWMLL